MPYPNEHAARITDPGQYDRIRRKNDAFGKGIDVIYGVKDGKSEVQAIRFDASKFTAAQAKKWLKDHDYTAVEFAEATGGKEADMEDEVEKKETVYFEAAIVPRCVEAEEAEFGGREWDVTIIGAKSSGTWYSLMGASLSRVKTDGCMKWGC